MTAQRVAAYRLAFDRLPAPFGDPSADERLAQDVLRTLPFIRSEHMARYLRARTAFFDRVVVNGLERDVTQVACIGAGYDGRPLRYAKSGVRWFEVDHPATQADKRLRLKRLKIEVSHIRFVALDLNRGGVDSALIDSGWDPDANSLMLCEGLAVYLDARVLETLLKDLRVLATAGARLALSLPLPATRADRRERFRAAIAAVGEPARNTLTSEQAAEILAATRWRAADVSTRSRRAGFAVAAPAWESAAAETPPTASRVGRYLERLYHRRGLDGLPRHLSDAYAIEVNGIRQLDVGVFRVERRDGPAWVARVFPESRPFEASRGDAEILQFLEQVAFPAERCAHPDPVTTYQDQAVMVTEHLPGETAKRSQAAFSLLGDVLGQLHTLTQLPAAATRPGGAWHHLVFQGSPRDEVAACVSLLDDAAARVPASQRTLYETLRQAASQTEDCDELPQSLIHPDFVPANAIASASGATTLVDWTGAGRGPRLSSLAFLLWAAGTNGLGPLDSVTSSYRRHVQLEGTELDRLADAIAARPVILACWAFATGRVRLPDTVDTLPTIRGRAKRIAARALSTLGEQH